MLGVSAIGLITRASLVKKAARKRKNSTTTAAAAGVVKRRLPRVNVALIQSPAGPGRADAASARNLSARAAMTPNRRQHNRITSNTRY